MASAAPSFYASTLSGVGGFMKGLITGGVTGALAGAVVGAAVLALTGGGMAALAGPALTTYLATGAMWGAGIMGTVGTVAGTVTSVVDQARNAYPPPLGEDVLKIAKESHERGVEIGHHIAMTRMMEAENKHSRGSWRDYVRRGRESSQHQDAGQKR